MSVPERKGRPQKIDRDELRRLYDDGVPPTVIAEYFGTSKSAVFYACDHLGLPARPKSCAADIEDARKRLNLPVRGKAAKPAPTRVAAASVERAAILEKIRASEDTKGGVVTPRFGGAWTSARDARIRDTRGRYSELAELARAWDMPTARVVARWHVVRVA